ncbi:MAG: FAD:protein FMN transferase [Candidatus Omnitrophota bacterium]
MRERWSHIINPVTGYPACDIVNATVVAPTALEADIYSTVLCVLGPRDGFRLIDQLGPGYAARVMFLGDDGHLQERLTSGFDQFRVGKRYLVI